MSRPAKRATNTDLRNTMRWANPQTSVRLPAPDPWPFIPKSTPGAFEPLLNQMRALMKDLVAIRVDGDPLHVVGYLSIIFQRFLILARAVDVDGSDACASPFLWEVFARLVKALCRFVRRCNVVLDTDLDINAIRPSIRSIQAMLDMVSVEFKTYTSIFLNAEAVKNFNVVVQFIPISYRGNIHQVVQMVNRSNLSFFRDLSINTEYNVLDINLQFVEDARENQELSTALNNNIMGNMQALKNNEAAVKRMCENPGAIDVSVYEFLSAQKMLEGVRNCRLAAMSSDLQLFLAYIRGPMAYLYKDGTYCSHFVYHVFSATESQAYDGIIFQHHVTPWHIKNCMQVLRYLQKRYGYSQDVMEKIMSDCILIGSPMSLKVHRSSVAFTVRSDARRRAARA